MRGARPDNVKTVDDLDTIPLIPDTTFKEYPSGKDFAHWLASLFTGDLPNITVKSATPTYDDVIKAFNAAGLVVTYSSGTSGKHTFIPRDTRTFLAAECAFAKLTTSMTDQAGYDAHSLQANHFFLFSPNPTKTNLFIGKASSLSFDLIKGDVQYAMDDEITIEVLQRAMRGYRDENKQAILSQSQMMQRLVERVVRWLERYEKANDTIALSGPPFTLYQVMDKLQKDEKRFDFGERGIVQTGGGWKIYDDKRIPHADFRKLMTDVLGIPETHCLDSYGMVEGNGLMVQCPEGHYFHAPYTYFKPLVLDDSLMPTCYGEWGRFAFLDAIAQSYPGFIISGDRVRLLERRPICDRPGPVLEPEIQRAKGEEVRGCAEEVRRIFAQDIAR
jgi:hypothetical protein